MAGERLTWTLGEAAAWLHPPVSERRLRALVRDLAVERAGHRHPGSGRGHPAAVYDIDEIIELHAAVLRWLMAAPP